jgi:hypothetical protein
VTGPRFLLDENLPRRAAALLSDFDYPFIGVGDEGAPTLGSSDAEIVPWCAKNGAVLVTLDHGRKSPEILKMLRTSGASALFLDPRMRMRDHLRILVCRYDDLCRKIEKDWTESKPFRARVAKRGGIRKYKV